MQKVRLALNLHFPIQKLLKFLNNINHPLIISYHYFWHSSMSLYCLKLVDKPYNFNIPSTNQKLLVGAR